MDELDRAVFESACDVIVAEASRAALENAVEAVIAPRLVRIVNALDERLAALEELKHWHTTGVDE